MLKHEFEMDEKKPIDLEGNLGWFDGIQVDFKKKGTIPTKCTVITFIH